MAIWYVRTTGSDTNSGTSANAAFATIGKAMTQASLAAGDTIYVGAGTYRLTATIAPTSMASMTYLYGDTDGSKTGDAGEVLVSNYGTNDSTAPNAIDVFTFASKNYWTIGKLTIQQGGSGNYAAVRITGTSQNLTFQDLTVYTLNHGILHTSPTFVTTALNFIVERCRLIIVGQGNAVLFTLSQGSTGSADVDAACIVRNCYMFTPGPNGGVGVLSVNAGTYKTGGVKIQNCTITNGYWSTGACIYQGTGTSTTYLTTVTNSLLISALNGVYAAATGLMTEDYNVIACATPRTNVTAGSNSQTTARNWRFSAGHESAYGGVTRPFGEPVAGSPLLTFGGTAVPTDDINGVTRPSSGAGQSSTQAALGAFERSNSGTRDASVYRTTSPSLLLTGPGYHDFELPVAATSTTFSAYVYRDANYAGMNPSISVTNGGECGVADATATDTGSASTWNKLSLTFTPTSEGIVTIRFRSSSTAATGKAWIDDLAS